jgi:hypothetical protein
MAKKIQFFVLAPTASETLVKKISGKNSLSTDSNIFEYSTCSRNLFIFNFVKFIATKRQLIYFFILLFVVVVGSGSGMEKNSGLG